MPRLLSTAQMVAKLAGMLNKDELSGWEEGFVTNVKRIADAGNVTQLTDAQVDSLADVYAKYFH